MATHIEGATGFVPAPSVLFRAESFGGLLFRRPEACFYGLTSTAYRILELCDGRHELSTIVAEITEEYAAPPEVVSADVHEFVGTMVEAGFLHPVEHTATGARE